MNSDDSVATAFLGGLFLGVVISLLVWNSTVNWMKADAVRNGAASWIANEEGRAEFQWGCHAVKETNDETK